MTDLDEHTTTITETSITDETDTAREPESTDVAPGPLIWTGALFALTVLSKFAVGHFDTAHLIGNPAGGDDPSPWAGPALLLTPLNLVQAGLGGDRALTAPVAGAVLTALGVAVALAALVLIPRARMLAIPAAMVLAGALSNLADRAGLWTFEAPSLLQRSAIDWSRLDGYNLADLLIGWGETALIVGIAITLLRRRRIPWPGHPVATLRRHGGALAGVVALALIGSLGGSWIANSSAHRAGQQYDQVFLIASNNASQSEARQLAYEYRLLRAGDRVAVCAGDAAADTNHLREVIQPRLDQLCDHHGPIPPAAIPSFVTYQYCLRADDLGTGRCPTWRISTTGPTDALATPEKH